MNKEEPIKIVKVSTKEDAIIFNLSNKAWCPDCDRVTTTKQLKDCGCCEMCDKNNDIYED